MSKDMEWRLELVHEMVDADCPEKDSWLCSGEIRMSQKTQAQKSKGKKNYSELGIFSTNLMNFFNNFSHESSA